MSRVLQRADAFIADFEQQARWYVREAGEDVAKRYLQALEKTLLLLGEHPGLGRLRRFHHPAIFFRFLIFLNNIRHRLFINKSINIPQNTDDEIQDSLQEVMKDIPE